MSALAEALVAAQAEHREAMAALTRICPLPSERALLNTVQAQFLAVVKIAQELDAEIPFDAA